MVRSASCSPLRWTVRARSPGFVHRTPTGSRYSDVSRTFGKGGSMKRLCLAAVMSCLAAPAALAQEHFTEGPVWECGSYRTKQGHFDDYMKYLRQNVLPQAQRRRRRASRWTKIGRAHV